MNFLLLSCKKATLLIEKSQVIPLSVREKLQVKLHTSMCSACRAYGKQSNLINRAVSNWLSASKQEKRELPDDIRNQIIRKLNK